MSVITLHITDAVLGKIQNFKNRAVRIVLPVSFSSQAVDQATRNSKFQPNIVHSINTWIIAPCDFKGHLLQFMETKIAKFDAEH